MESEIKKGAIFTKEQLEKLGLKDTGKRFGMNISTTDIVKLPLYINKEKTKEYALEPVGKDKYKVYAERKKL